MLYVFQMDIGQMLTFDMSLLMDTVARLQTEISKTTGISVDQQILLLSGGQSLKADQKVMTYGAGADTNPVFLFSKLAIESQEPPVIRSYITAKDAIVALKERVSDTMNMRPSFETVSLRAKLAVQMRDSASSIYDYCKQEFQEQHLQHQGWGAVIANLEEIADALQRTEIKFTKVFHAFLPHGQSHLKMLEGFGEVLALMSQIPLLDSLKDPSVEGMECKFKGSSERSIGGSFHEPPSTLLEWISSQAQGQGIDCLHHKCEDDLKLINESMFEGYDKQVQDLLTVVRMDPNQMKELVGIERRLSELEKRLNEAKRIASSQSDMAQGIIVHQSKLGSVPDVNTILPDLCESHKQQLAQMLEYQQRIVALQNNFRNSKQEMSRNIHQRLGWVMHVETKIAKLDSELIFHIKTLKVLECNLDLLSQIKVAPQVYADLVVETARRIKFSDKFSQWAEMLEEDSNHLFETETERRKNFSLKHGEHFLLHTMFKGFEGKPQTLTTKVPRLLDANLPEITIDEISWLKSTVPELEESLSFTQPSDDFPSDLLCTYPRYKSSLSATHSSPSFNSQQSHSQAPCVVTATEGPAKPFTVLEVHTSKDTCHKATPTISEGSKKDAPEESLIGDVSKKGHEDEKAKGCKEIQTTVIHVDKCVGTSVESESETSKVVVAGKPISTTESSSPHSSNEFATADFYFEDSMPSPMVESATDRKAIEQSKSQSKEDLVIQLKEKGDVIEELNNLLRQKEEEVSKLQNELQSQGGENSEDEFFSMIGTLEGGECSVKEVPDKETKIVESAFCQTENSVDDRVKDLEQKLEKLTQDLNQSQLSLTKAEQNLQTVQEEEQTNNERNSRLIAQLQEEIAEKKANVERLSTDLETKGTEVSQLKDGLNASNNENEELQKQLNCGNEARNSLEKRLQDFAAKTGQTVPMLRENLESLKMWVKENLSQLDMFKNTEVCKIEKEILSFGSIISSLKHEKECLKTEISQLEKELSKVQSDSVNEVNDLKSQIDSLKTELTRKGETFDLKCIEQKRDFDSSLKDIETKHALEMEIELDKCKSEMTHSLMECERKYDGEKDKNGTLFEEIETMKIDFEKETENIINMNKQAITELEAKHETEKQECISDWEEKVKEFKSQIQALETEAAATAAAVIKEKEDSIESLRIKLTTEYDEHIQDMVQKHKEQSQKYAETIEDLQLHHAYKLTELKKSFDQERDIIQSELMKYRDNETTCSQTQTERELLAEVISLTSSASDGMEELIPPKATEDMDLAAKPKSPGQSSDEEGNSEQLEKAHDTIRSLEEKMKLLASENDELKDKLRSHDEESVFSQMVSDVDPGRNEYQGMMQTSGLSRSFILMDKEKQPGASIESDDLRMKVQKIAQLEKHIMEMSMTTSGRVKTPDKISFRGCEIGDLVLLCLDVKHDQYVVFTVGTYLHFLHSESLEALGLKTDAEAANRKPWILAEVMDKEYCLAKKSNNRFRVPQGTCFYRVKCQPWKCDVDLTKPKDPAKQKTSRNEPSASGGKAKKAEKK